MIRRFKFPVLSLYFLLCGASLLRAQGNANASISGRVADGTGAALVGATVKVTEQQTSVSVSKVTGSGGFYTFPELKPGIYSVTVSSQGFTTMIRTNISLEIQQVARVDFTLAVGAVTQQVTVESAPPLLSTETTELGNVVTEDDAQQLPLNGRNFTQLGTLVPGASGGAPGSVRSTGGGQETARAGSEIVADGSRGDFNLFLIDGIDDSEQAVGTVKIFPNLESIQEFKVEVGNYLAEFSAGGAVVNVATRSGTNVFHGSAFEFIRNRALNTRQYFDTKKPQYQQNQFGAALGGPIFRDKAFFFADYQGLRVHQATTTILSEPTSAMRRGDFSASAFPVIYNPNTTPSTPFPGNMITNINPIAQNLLSVLPLPNLPGVFNNFQTAPLKQTVQDQYDVRVDQTISKSNSMFERFTQGRSNITYPYNPIFSSNNVINPLGFLNLTDNYAPSLQGTVQDITTASPALVNQALVAYSRFPLSVQPNALSANVSQLLGVAGSNTGTNSGGLVSFGITSLSGYGQTNAPEIVTENTIQATDTVSYDRGRHSMKFGFNYVRNDFGFFQTQAPTGNLTFSGTYTSSAAAAAGSTASSGVGFADFLLGIPVSSVKTSAIGGAPFATYSEYGAFAQDQWRVRSRLTANLGLRYDVITPEAERHNRQSDFLFTTGILVLANQGGYSSTIIQLRKNDFSPRIGLAYQLGHQLVARAAFGYYFFPDDGSGGANRLFNNMPFITFFNTSCSNTTPCINLSTGVPATSSASNIPNTVYKPLTNLTPNMSQWNLTFERQFAKFVVARASYVGSKGTHLNLDIDENVAVPGPGAVPPRRPWPQVAQINSWMPIGNSSYNGLQLSAESRGIYGLSFLASYTWSKSIDNGPGGNATTGDGRINIQNPRNLRGDRSLSDFNMPNRFTLRAVYQIPFGRDRRFMAGAGTITNALLGGWQLTSIVSLQSGTPFSVQLGTATANTGTFTRPNEICNPKLSGSSRSILQWYNTACFVAPPLYTFGNTPRDAVIGPNYEDWDVGIDKDYKIRKALSLQFRAEAFNALNHTNFGLPNGTIGTSAAGTITSEPSNTRQIQFSGRFHW